MALLKEELDTLAKYGALEREVPSAVVDNLNPELPLRPYQEDALLRFMFYVSRYEDRVRPTQLLFHMATGSGKTLVMAAAILYLYQQGYRNFLFFVDSTTIIEKTRDNFLNPQSSKYLFVPQLKLDGQRVTIHPVNNFQAINGQSINILFSTIQGLHTTLNTPRENALTYSDFETQPIVLISDEAHHINALTKSSKQRNAGDVENINTWEATVNRIFQAHPDNLLLEFTATAELSHPSVSDKYRDKLLFDYPLRQFREDGYSKEVKTLQADLPQMARALQAVVVSQYRRKVAERHGLNLKPVILMKANYVNPPKESDPNKVVSAEFRAKFEQRIAGLTGSDLATLRDGAESKLVKRAFAFFETEGINLNNLARELRDDFSPDKALSVDSKSDNETNQLLVNSLETPDNPIRVVYAVEMLNEGWDVLNLFDIVRLYDTRDARANQPGKTTVAEAQLIGRGARYYPFLLDETQSRFQRKFDDDPDNDLRALEELYYHSAHNPRYIQELHTALVDIGMMPEQQTRKLQLNLKDGFRNSDFWEHGLLFTNNRVRNDNADVLGIQDTLIGPRYSHELRTGFAQDTILLDEPGLPQAAETHTKTVALGDFGVPLLRTALARLPFYEFRRLQRYFPNLTSITEFITGDTYLSQIEVDVRGLPTQIDRLSPDLKMEIALEVLRKLADDVRRGTPTFRGTYEFHPHPVSEFVREKTLNIAYNPATDVGTGMRETINMELHADLRQEEWYVYDENYGTSEEKALVKFVQSQIPALRQKYEDIYLLRNEKLFKLYDFAEGRPFEPDFVLFLKEKATGQMVRCQLFIEPKGQHLVPHDAWKEEFLLQIAGNHRITYTVPNTDFRVIGLPFYNTGSKRQAFEKAFRGALH